MNNEYIIKNISIINSKGIIRNDIHVKGKRFHRIGQELSSATALEIDGSGMYAMPGLIDDQVHFREPGLTHKANIGTESRAAVAGGVTSFMEMPNTVPQAVTKELLEEKYKIAAATSPANYSFFMGTTNANWEEAISIDPKEVCGIKVFMGSSTGNMLVDDVDTLKKIFCGAPSLVAIHSETESIINDNLQQFVEKYGEDIPFSAHPEIRSVEACVESTKKAIAIAKECQTRLHILHISTQEEAEMFDKGPLEGKLITSEACVHHLWFSADQYDDLGSLIKCNPAIKAPRHRDAVMKALLEDGIDVIATDHAPHTWEEKQSSYLKAPSGLPLVQHSLNMLLDFYHQDKLSLEKIAEKAAEAPASLFRIVDRGYIEEGMFADFSIIDLHKKWTVSKDNILHKCGWSPLDGHEFTGRVEMTFVSGRLAWDGTTVLQGNGDRLKFDY